MPDTAADCLRNPILGQQAHTRLIDSHRRAGQASREQPWTIWKLALQMLAVFAVGCDSGPQLGQVSGQVTLDGEALPEATVIFTPQGGGPYSRGETDASGHYELMFDEGQPGAVIGEHTVTVETRRFHIEGSVEKVPPKYNTESLLTREVMVGAQQIDLDLKTD